MERGWTTPLRVVAFFYYCRSLVCKEYFLVISLLAVSFSQGQGLSGDNERESVLSY